MQVAGGVSQVAAFTAANVHTADARARVKLAQAGAAAQLKVQLLGVIMNLVTLGCLKGQSPVDLSDWPTFWRGSCAPPCLQLPCSLLPADRTRLF
jgi:hypothetical protein